MTGIGKWKSSNSRLNPYLHNSIYKSYKKRNYLGQFLLVIFVSFMSGLLQSNYEN
jgi:hypothetical protein